MGAARHQGFCLGHRRATRRCRCDLSRPRRCRRRQLPQPVPAGWRKFVKDYQDAFPPNKRFPSPSLLATNYYGSTMALILALRQVNGDLSNNQAKLKEALAKIELDAPNGKIKLDTNRQAIGTNFVTEVVDDGKGALFSKVVKVIPNVNQTLGYDPAVFAKIGLPSRTVPECKKY